MMSRLLNETHFAVITGGVDPADGLFDLNRGELYGTAFQLAPSLFITARHVYLDAVAAAAGKGHVAVGTVIGEPRGQIVSDAEEFEQIDLAILRCEGLQTPALSFDFTPLEYMDEVAALGFPFGLNLAPPAPPVQILRAFRGYIVTRRGLTELSALAPPGYETSFVPPPGLSGAPLLSLGDTLAVRGVVLKEYVAELLHAPERKMALGIALDIEELLTLDSRLVGGSIAERIFGRERVAVRDGTP